MKEDDSKTYVRRAMIQKEMAEFDKAKEDCHKALGFAQDDGTKRTIQSLLAEIIRDEQDYIARSKDLF